jgi:hypothetical protein
MNSQAPSCTGIPIIPYALAALYILFCGGKIIFF